MKILILAKFRIKVEIKMKSKNFETRQKYVLVFDYIEKYLNTKEEKRIQNEIKKASVNSFYTPYYETIDKILQLKFQQSLLFIRHNALIKGLQKFQKDELKLFFYIFVLKKKFKDIAEKLKISTDTLERKKQIIADKIIFILKETYENEC